MQYIKTQVGGSPFLKMKSSDNFSLYQYRSIQTFSKTVFPFFYSYMSCETLRHLYCTETNVYATRQSSVIQSLLDGRKGNERGQVRQTKLHYFKSKHLFSVKWFLLVRMFRVAIAAEPRKWWKGGTVVETQTH